VKKSKTNLGILNSRFADKLSYFLRYYEASNLACGLMVARCEVNGDPDWSRLKERLQESDPNRAAQFLYDESSRLLVVLLDDTSLSDTHYFALPLKTLLQAHHQLEGQVFVASYPESGETMEVIWQEVVDRMNDPMPHSDLIQIVVCAKSATDQKPRLLLVESDPVVRQMLAVRFERNGYEVQVAHDGKEGMAKYRELQPDVVITELTLPIVDGYQLIDWLREQRNEQTDCKIVVLTDKRLEEDMTKCFERGVADYITKPFSPVELDWRVKRLLVS